MKPSCLCESRWSVGSRRGAAFLLVCTAACSTRTHNGSLQTFVQSGNTTLVDVIGREGDSWKILSVTGSSFNAYTVLDSNQRVALTASVFEGQTRARHAVVRVDADEKEAVLAVLDRGFLTGVANQTEAYKGWAGKDAIFAFGAVQETVMIDMKSGSLGTGTATAGGGGIVTHLEINCHCFDDPQCAVTTDPVTAECINRVCDFVNCVFGGKGSVCGEQLATAEAACNAASRL